MKSGNTKPLRTWVVGHEVCYLDSSAGRIVGLGGPAMVSVIRVSMILKLYLRMSKPRLLPRVRCIGLKRGNLLRCSSAKKPR